MRTIILSIVAAMSVSATEPVDDTPPPAQAEKRTLSTEQAEERSPENCRDRIQFVRAERGLPKFDDEPAKPDDALLIAAVDHQVAGCDVLVMRHDTSDIRPLPRFEGKTVELIPAR